MRYRVFEQFGGAGYQGISRARQRVLDIVMESSGLMPTYAGPSGWERSSTKE